MIGERLRSERQRLGFNQSEFAAMAGAKKGAQILWEKGSTSPSAEALQCWAVAGLDVSFVVTGRYSDLMGEPPCVDPIATLLEVARGLGPEDVLMLQQLAERLRRPA